MSVPILSVVIPVYNEGDHLLQVTARVTEVLSTLDLTYEMILVDDGSQDQSWPDICRAAGGDGRIRGLRLSRNFGKEAALAAGLADARGEAVVIMDGDLQHPPELIPTLVEIWQSEGVPIVEAVKRDKRRTPLWHRLCTKIFYSLLSGLPGEGLDGATDFKLLDRRAVEAWRRMGERNVFFRGMAAWLGFPRREVPFSVPERVGGRTRWAFFQLVRLAVTGITSFTSLPLQLTTLIGGVFLAFSILLGGQTLYMKFFGGGVDGFTTVILLLLITGSCIMISLGVMGTYIARIYEEVKARPRFLVADRCGDPEDPPLTGIGAATSTSTDA
ncbi:MAG: glycosyltransferase family 2 protein [Acidobacteriota bacterium]|nr:glycosyltransferase family 2 protein [Acidobacteriota bacterium]